MHKVNPLLAWMFALVLLIYNLLCTTQAIDKTDELTFCNERAFECCFGHFINEQRILK